MKDEHQPVFLLAALVVPEACWQVFEKDLEDAIVKALPSTSLETVEIHCTDLRSGRGSFKGVEVEKRATLRNEWLGIAKKHALKVIYRKIVKTQFERWMSTTFGTGVTMHPQVPAFALVARVVNDYITNPPCLGMFISDENTQVMHPLKNR